MTTNTLRMGNKVQVTAGPFAGAKGTIADIQPECSVIRIQDDADSQSIYALIDTVRPVEVERKKNVLSKRG